LRLLILSHNANLQALLKDYFRARGYDVRIISRVNEALSTVHTFLPEALIVDTTTPGVDGNQLRAEVRADSKIEYTAFVFIVPHFIEAEKLKLYEEYGDDCLTSPFDVEELSVRISNVCAVEKRRKRLDGRNR
jgi:DNA-binding response OmpR family regulator